MRSVIDARRVASGALLFLSYVAVFAVLMARHLPEFGSRLPLQLSFLDSQLIVWLLSWGSHALVTAPSRLFDANINYPAPAQLTCSDHLLSTQLAYAPLYALTGNALLATNLVGFLSYPVAAFAIERLARRLGLGAAVAWVTGLLFAVGPIRIPFNLAMLQALNLYYPFTALALVGLRDRPGARGAAVLAFVFAAGILSGYYAAALVGVVAVLWGVCELARGGPGRIRFALWATAAGLVSATVLVLILRPYLARGASVTMVSIPLFPGWLPADFAATTFFAVPIAQRALALLGIAAALVVRPLRRAVVPALLLVLVGTLLQHGFPAELGSAVSASPLRALRYMTRFRTVAAFGEVLLFAAGLDAIRRVGGGTIGGLAVAAALLVPCSTARYLSGVRMLEVPALTRYRPLHDLIRRTTENDRGALLELPLYTRPRADGGGPGTEPESMVASTRHWLPLVGGYGGYLPPHRVLVLGLAELGTDDILADEKIDDLADMTRFRWLLLRPAAEWRSDQELARVLRAVRRPGWSSVAAELDGWTLLRVDRPPRHAEWFDAIRSGGRRGETILGTPLAPLPPEAASGFLEVSRTPRQAFAGRALAVLLRVGNTGTVAWPAVPPPRMPPGLNLRYVGGPANFQREHTVVVASRWRPVAAPGGKEPQGAESPLRRDLSPGDTITQALMLGVPEQPGEWELELRLAQVGDPAFADARPLRLPVSVLPRQRPAPR